MNFNGKTEKSVKVAVVLHPLNLDYFYELFNSLYRPYSCVLRFFIRRVPSYYVRDLFSKLPAHIFLTDKNIRTRDNEIISLYGIMCPLFAEQMVLNKDLATRKIIEAIKLAEGRGIRIVALAGFTSIVTDGGRLVVGKVKSGITSGNTLTAALTIEGIEKAAKLFNKRIEDCSVAIIGATGDIGSICARVFSSRAKRMFLCSRNISLSSQIVTDLKSHEADRLVVTNNVKLAARSADIVITATSAIDYLIDSVDLKAGAIVCDVSMPPNIAKQVSKERNDVFVFEGGRAQLDFYDCIKNKKWKCIFPINSVYGCLAEAIVLALEEKFGNYSIGKGEITKEKLAEILRWARSKQIDVSEFARDNRHYTTEEINYIRECNK